MEIRELLSRWPGLSEGQVSRLQAYYEAVLVENDLQNLTRITSPVDFYEEHLGDVRILAEGLYFRGGVLDLGSGGGLPGLPLAIVRPDLQIVLSDSEKKKADFLQRAIDALEIDNATAVGERGEVILRKNPEIHTIISRAVGPISRIYAWIENCSTWNTLVLLKGPSWNAEWDSFESKKARKALRVIETIDYEVGNVIKKQRKLIVLQRSSLINQM